MNTQSEIIDILRRANDLLLRREPEEARIILDTIDRTSEMHGAAAFLYGNSFLQEDSYEKAHTCYAEAVKSGLAYDQLFLNLGTVKEQLNDLAGAEVMYRQAAELNLAKANALDKIIALCLRLGNIAGAEQAADELMRRNPELLDGFHHKAMLLLAVDRAKEALKLLYDVAERFSSQPVYVYDLCRTLAHMNHSEEALEFLLEKEDVFSNIFYRQMFIKQKASLLMDLGRVEEAEPLWCELYANYADRQAGVALISTALQREDFEAAFRLTDTILSSGTKDIIYYFCLYVKVIVLKAKKSESEENALQKAVTEFEALKEHEIGQSLRILRAVVLTAAGKKEQASADFDSVESFLIEEEAGDNKDELMAQFSAMRDEILKEDSI